MRNVGLAISVFLVSAFSSACVDGLTASEWQTRYTAPLAAPLEMPFWLKPEWYGRVPEEDFGDHPCGGYGTVKATRIPKFPANQPLAPSLAFEVIDGERTSVRWNLPINNQIWAVAGDWLLIDETSSDGPPFWVNRDGRILASRDIPPAWLQSNGRWCPASLGEEGSYFCAALHDIRDGRPRTIAGETVCT